MSGWKMWCVDGDDERLSAEEDDIFFTWEWRDRWTLEAILPKDKMMVITKKGTLTHFHCEEINHPGIVLRAFLNWDRHVWLGDNVYASDLKLTVDEGVILLMEEYLPVRPAA